MKNKYIFTACLISAFLLVGLVSFAEAASTYSQSIDLVPGWNIISTPRVVDSHEFSAPETSGNFSIFVLNADDPSGWSTMASLGQSEFTPLYGYFIYNNTGILKTLLLNYKNNLSPNEKLFERKFTKTGWYSIGAANPTYAKPQGSDGSDANNVDKILDSLVSKTSSVIDFTNANSNLDSVGLADPWLGVVVSQINNIKDLRELKGYAMYIDEANALLNGFQTSEEPIVIPPVVGTISVENASTVGSQNVAINIPNQPLGGFTVDVAGEPISVASMNFDISIIDNGSNADTNDLTNITLVNESGVVVAGPVDGVAGGNNTIHFTDAIVFPIGQHTFTLKGKVGTDFLNNDQITASTTPSVDWVTIRGVNSGATINPTTYVTSAVTMNTMTVKAAAVYIALSADTQRGTASSTSQNVVAGTSGYKFTDYVLDATTSGEDIRVNAMQMLLTFSSANSADDLTNCTLFDGGSALTSGSNIVNPSNSDSSPISKTFSFDSSLIVPKGTTRTLSLKCNLVSGAASGHQWSWGISDADTSLTATGMVSGQTVDGSDMITGDEGRIITAFGAGSLSLTLDSSSPSSVKWVQSGSTDNVMAILRLNAINEAIRVDTLGLQLGADGGNASNSPSDLTKVTLWVGGGTKVGEAVFTASDYATATLSGVTVPKDGQILLTIKADMGNIGTGLSARPGHLISVNYDANASSDETNLGAVGVGLSSGATVSSGGSDTSTNGVRIARAIPTVAKINLGSSHFSNSSNQVLYRFKITTPASGNGVSLYKMTFDVATSTVSTQDTPGKTASSFRVENFELYCFSDASFSVASCNSFDNSGLLNQGGLANASHDENGDSNVGEGASGTPAVSIRFNPTDSTQGSTPEAIRLAAGETKYFALLADVTGASNSPSITVKMNGDSTFASINDAAKDTNLTIEGDDWSTGRYIFATTAANVDAWDNDDFIWSGNSTNTSQSVSDYDWFNGFLVPGLSNSDAGSSEVLTF